MTGLTRSVPILGIALLAFTATASADPPPCKRWANSLTVCEALGIGSSTNCTHTPQDIEIEQVNAQLFASTAQKACNQYIKKMNPAAYGYNSSKTIKACTWSTTDPNDPTCYPIWENPFNPPDEGTTAWCVYDVTSGPGEPSGPDGEIDWYDATSLSYQVSYLTQTPDAHCFCTANGPYKDTTWQWESESNWAIAIAWLRHTFPKGLKSAVLAENLMKNGGAYKSDAKLNGVNFDPEPNLQKNNIYDGDAAEIDHIIPRVDSKGCLCGDVTINNAAVISRALNGPMSNTSPLYNADRAKMFEEYVTCPGDVNAKFQGKNYEPACDAEPLQTDPQTDESIIDVEFEVPRGWEPPKSLVHEATEPGTSTETGGCSTGGLTGLGVALSLLGLRRRRAIARA